MANIKRIDVEEDVTLVDVDNAAAASLFSPTMWVRKPSRQHGMYQYETKQAVSPQYINPSPLKDSSNLQHQRQRPAKRHAVTSLDDLQEAIDKEGTEKEQTEQDLAHIAQLEESILHAQALAKRLEIKLHETRNNINTTIRENTRIKRLFSALQVQRDDFDLEGVYGEQPRKKRMIDIGNRLIDNLNGVPQQPKQDKDNNHDNNKDNNNNTDNDGNATNDNDTDNANVPRSESRRQSQRVIVANTNNGGETPAPTLAGADAKLNNNNNQAQMPAVTPPAQFPAESQIAAAALTLAQGDPAAALLSLLEKALSARAPAQQLHHHNHVSGGGGNENGHGAVPTQSNKSLSLALNC